MQLQALAEGALQGTRAPGQAAAGAFWLRADGGALPAGRPDRETVASIVGELKSSNRQLAPSAGGVLGPMRIGSQWLIVVRSPITSPATSAAAPQAGWSIAYRDLEQFLIGADAGRLNRAGYDIEWSQRQGGADRAQIFFATRPAPLTDAAVSPIHFPAAFPHALPEGAWSVALRPRRGWYPLVELATDGAILTAAAWLLTLVAYDVTRSSRRWHAALQASKRRLENANAQLRGEIERREDLQKSLEHARYHDAFTGLPNRRYFMDQLDRVLRTARIKRGYRLAVILVGIERFRLINDTLGHTAGDELMLQVARRFQNIASPAERVISRWSGDQFAVLLHNL